MPDKEETELELAADILENLQVSDIVNFQDNIVWKGILGYIDAGIMQSQAILESALDVEDIRNAQGRIAELRTLKGLPDTIKEQIKLDKEDAKKED